jgi:hypothetical protein
MDFEPSKDCRSRNAHRMGSVVLGKVISVAPIQ